LGVFLSSLAAGKTAAWGNAVPIYRLLQNSAFDPDTVKLLATAFDEACRALGLAERTDPLRDTVARKIIEIAQTGERDPVRLCDKTLEALRA
jgi:hypothetical protein